jgi:LysM repeat protein
MYYGVDLSHYNAVADAAAMRAGGIAFAWCKATEGTATVDASFAGKVAQLRAAGIVVGAYHFLTAAPVAAQAEHFRAVAAAAGCLSAGALAPMLDCEATAVAGTVNVSVPAFHRGVRAALLDVYGNLDWWQHFLRPAVWGAGTVGHIARYNGQPGNPGYTNPAIGVHQHTDHGTVPGIPGVVDRDATMPGWDLARLVLGGTVPSPPANPPAPAAPSPTGDVWQVAAGDTLSRIASAWHTTVAAVAAANGIPDPDRIVVGQVIHRPGTGPTAPPPVPSASGARYVVRRGDTVTGIAGREHTTAAVLVALNHLANPDRIQAGQVLLLPGAGAAGNGGGQHVYTVRVGDTLGTIAARLGYPGGWPALAAHNHLPDPNRITPGETIRY